jgi:hypothetical protein
VAAAVLLLRGDFNAAFVAAAIGLVSWFLNYRTQVRQSLATEDIQDSDDQKGDNNSDET